MMAVSKISYASSADALPKGPRRARCVLCSSGHLRVHTYFLLHMSRGDRVLSRFFAVLALGSADHTTFRVVGGCLRYAPSQYKIFTRNAVLQNKRRYLVPGT